jgi:hypothetical protein
MSVTLDAIAEERKVVLELCSQMPDAMWAKDSGCTGWSAHGMQLLAGRRSVDAAQPRRNTCRTRGGPLCRLATFDDAQRGCGRL